MSNKLQRTMCGHGILMIFSTLLFGVFLWMNLVGGFEIVPATSSTSRFPALRKAGPRPIPARR